MRKKIVLAALMVVSVSSSALAMDKLSYTLGFKAAAALKEHMGDSLVVDDYMKGFTDGVKGIKPVISDAQMQQALVGFKMQLMEKMKDKTVRLASDNLKASEAFMKKNKSAAGVKVLEPGLQYKVLQKGNGPKPSITDRVSVTYTGRLISGKVFDKSNTPVTFGLSQVIPGWTKALSEMPVGSKWRIFIDPKLAYGEQAPPVIGPNQALIFDVELKGIEK